MVMNTKEESSTNPPGEENEDHLPEAGHNKMPIALFLVWVAFICFGVVYMIKFSVPDLVNNWLQKP